jgi:hypothetical protein
VARSFHRGSAESPIDVYQSPIQPFASYTTSMTLSQYRIHLYGCNTTLSLKTKDFLPDRGGRSTGIAEFKLYFSILFDIKVFFNPITTIRQEEFISTASMEPNERR